MLLEKIGGFNPQCFALGLARLYNHSDFSLSMRCLPKNIGRNKCMKQFCKLYNSKYMGYYQHRDHLLHLGDRIVKSFAKCH